MASDQPFGMGGFFQGMLGDLLKMVHTDAPLQWDLALQFAQNIAADGADDGNVEPVDRIRLEQLLSIAELHVADVTGMTLVPAGKSLSIVAAGRAEWARRSLESWRPLVEQIAAAFSPPKDAIEAPELSDEASSEEQEFGELLAKWAIAISPMMASMQVGSVVGHLAQRALYQHELLLPRTGSDYEIVVIPSNARSFAEDWSLSLEDLSLYLVVRDITINAIITRPHVAARLSELLIAHAHGFRTDPSALTSSGDLGGLGDLGDFGELTKMLGDPAALRELTETPELAATRNELSALNSAIDGYAEWVTSSVIGRVSDAGDRVREALRRHRVERGDEARTADQLFGLSTDQAALDKGEAFIRGVLEREGDQELAKLWVVESYLPTPAEIAAPGLWLERIKLPTDS